MPAKLKLPITGDPDADRLLQDSPLALLIGMLLDQQVPMEWAFAGPKTLNDRLGHLDVHTIAAMDVAELVAAFVEKPALHRYPKSMGERVHKLCGYLVEHHGGDPASVWTEAESGSDLFKRLQGLPGFGKEKSRIFLALLAKRFDVTPEGWEEAAGPFADAANRSVADIDSPEALDEVRRFKKEMKARGKGKAD